MSAAARPFVTQLRARPGIVAVAGGSAARVTVRVELPDQWDTIACEVASDATVLALKQAALAAFGLGGAHAEDYLFKVHGTEVLAEQGSIAESGARDGTTFLLMYRRRRPVR
ncbi:MAG: hypothetical protein HYR75_06810 [Gemmatimonadetes bacterium]|nr:hypothetical protein [Gemmatimonadota bacterium]MBI3566707.1 hypothetical protein [Gemmatimonadota bacterium]